VSRVDADGRKVPDDVEAGQVLRARSSRCARGRRGYFHRGSLRAVRAGVSPLRGRLPRPDLLPWVSAHGGPAVEPDRQRTTSGEPGGTGRPSRRDARASPAKSRCSS